MVGQKISHYEILEELGRGAMGAVYKARDVRLDRLLAFKILHRDFANPTRERRFLMEAKTASSLNHPNIVTIYDIFRLGEAPCIAMEYVAGESLEQELERGPLRRRKGLDYAVQIADALAAAHAEGIVHRDVKPANIMITGNGLVKILDFGLAKLMDPSEDAEPGARLTREGRIVGTPPYLSPEQAKGEEVDARSDIFSLGAVLYEVFSGVRPFERETQVDMMSAVIRDQPKKIRSLVKDFPATLEKIISRCLEKKAERRYQRMADARDALQEVRQHETLSSLLAAQSTRPVWKSWQPWMLAGMVALTAAGGLLWRNQRPGAIGTARPPVLTRITFDDGLTTDPAVSPDGRFFAYASDRGGESLDIWIQPSDGGQVVRLTTNPSDDREPVFSPDGSSIAFRSERDGGGVYVTSIVGGQERLIVQGGRRPRFSPDGKWLVYWTGFSTGDPTSPGSNKIFVVPSVGGTPKELVPQFESALYPVWSPDGKHVLFLGSGRPHTETSTGPLTGTNRPVDRMDWWVTGLDEGPPVKTGVHEALRKQGLSVWASSGAGIAPDVWLPEENKVVFSASTATPNAFRNSENLWAIPLAANRWIAAGPAQQLTSGTTFESAAAAKANGDILFSSAEVKTAVWMLPLHANQGKAVGELELLTKGASFHGQPSVSPDGSKVVYYDTKSGNMDIRILDRQSGKEYQLTSTPIGESAPLISDDASKVYYSIYGRREAYAIAANGGEAVRICTDCGTWDISHDNTKLLYWYSVTRPIVSIGMLQLPDGGRAELISHPDYSLYQPHFAPDDRWIAFLAKTGQDRSRIYVTRYRGPILHNSEDWLSVTNGESLDDKPRWSPDGTLIYFTSDRDGFRCIWAQRLNGATKLPVMAPFAVRHFHESRRSLRNVGLGPLEISVARTGMVFNLGEITGNIWMASRQ